MSSKKKPAKASKPRATAGMAERTDFDFSPPNSRFSLPQSGLVPKLRFPEFQGTGHWESRTLGSIGSFSSGGTPSKENPVYWNGTIPWVSASSMYELVIEKADHYVTPAAIGNGTRLARKGSILILVRGSMLFNRVPICVAGVDVAFNQDVKALEVISSVDTGFLLYELSAFQSRFQINETGIGAGKIELDQLQKFALGIPGEKEQQKIASCLSSLDELIAAQARKLEALRTHKKALMQQLFPRDGETTPRLRFPEFQDAGEWEGFRMDTFSRIIRGASPRPQGDPRYFGGPVPRLMVQDVTRDGKWVTPCIDSLTEEGANLSRPCPAGTLTIVCSGVVGIVSFLAIDACIHDGFLALMDINERITQRDFLFHSLSTLREQFERGATHGGVFTNLTTQTIKEFEIRVPGLPEQHRIAACLTSLDDLITAQTQKLESLRTHKKALMQQLFPTPEEYQT
jgi:type I restriction enzyme S subunit